METLTSDISRSACFTGHRPSKFPFDIGNEGYLRTFLSQVYLLIYEAVANKKIDTFYCGMQVGMDVWAGKMVLEQKREIFPDLKIKLICVCPFEEEINRRWGKDLDDYIMLRDQCDEFITLGKSYDKYCYKRRNEYMVERSGYVIAALADYKSGTYNTIKYAEKLGREVHVIDLNKFAAEHGFTAQK